MKSLVCKPRQAGGELQGKGGGIVQECHPREMPDSSKDTPARDGPWGGWGQAVSRAGWGEGFTAGKAPWEHGPSPRGALVRSGAVPGCFALHPSQDKWSSCPPAVPMAERLDPAPLQLSHTCLSSETLSHSRSCRLERSCSSSARSWSIWGQGHSRSWFCHVLRRCVCSVRSEATASSSHDTSATEHGWTQGTQQPHSGHPTAHSRYQ